MVMEWWIFSSIKVSHSRWSSYFVCDCRCTHTHMLLAHFLRTARSLRTSHIFMRVTHAWLKVMKKMFVACACRLSWFLSCFTRLRLLFLHGHFETNSTDAPVHTIRPNFPGPKARVKRTPHEDEQFGYLATSVLLTGYMSPKSSTRPLPWMLTRRPSTIPTIIPLTSRRPQARTLDTVFWILCFARLSLVILFFKEKAKKACLGKPLQGREREEREGSVTSVAESVSRKSRRNSARSHSLQTQSWWTRSPRTPRTKSSKSYSWWKYSSEKIVLDWVRHGDPKFGAKKFRIRIIRVATRAWISKTTVVARYSLNRSSSAWENTFV